MMDDATPHPTTPNPAPTGTRRRDLLRGAIAAGIGAGAGLSAGLLASSAAEDDAAPRASGPDTSGTPATGRAASVAADGDQQAGIARPDTPQPHGLLLALDLPGVPEPGAADAAFRDRLRELCAGLGRSIMTVTSTDRADTAGLLDGPGDLTVTVGLGPRVMAALDPQLPGAEPLPAFAGDDAVPATRAGGDLLIAAYGSDPNDVHRAGHWLADAVPDATVRWSQRGFRAPGSGTVARNPLGFHDGVIVPRGDHELAEHVWIPDGPMAGGSICVVRRLRLDTTAFAAEPVEHQEAVIGRHRHDGSPLSGGGPSDEVDLLAKTPDGQYVTPVRSHVRAAHPALTGSHLMLRRGYAFDDGAMDGAADAGLLFICFQRDLRTFVQTQFRLDETDALAEYVTPTGSATFLILPGFSADRPLGATLP